MHALPADKPPDSQPSSSPNGSEQAVVLHAALEQIRGRFAPQCWQAFWRSQIEGRPRADVAVELEMTVAAVNQAAYRVRRRLKEVLQDRSELPGCR
jgi:DNA-directed RNA polymerase specialized sigma24 family protein